MAAFEGDGPEGEMEPIWVRTEEGNYLVAWSVRHNKICDVHMVAITDGGIQLVTGKRVEPRTLLFTKESQHDEGTDFSNR